MATCYRHSNRETGVSCSNCGNPICPDCMTATPVGMRCPECAKQKTKVRTVASIAGGDPTVTYVLMGICVLAALGAGGVFGDGGTAYYDLALTGTQRHPYTLDIVGVGESQYWRLITTGFLHGGVFHILANLYALFFLGSMLEPMLGRVRYAALYFASLLGGSFGALLLDPDKFTVGASGAVFGLMGATLVLQQARGIGPMQSGLGPIILINLAISVIPGLNISLGGHLGGLAAGVVAGFVIEAASGRRRAEQFAVAGCVAIAVAAVIGSLAAAGAYESEIGLSVVTSALQ